MTLDLSLLSQIPYVGGVLAHMPQILSIAAALVAAASAIAAVIPHPQKLDGWLATIRKAVDWLALNVGHATPAARTSNEPGNNPASAQGGSRD